MLDSQAVRASKPGAVRGRFALAWALLGLGVAAALPAQERSLFSVALSGGLAGPLGEDADAGFGQAAVQLAVAAQTDDRTWTSLRWGRVELDEDERPGAVSAASLDYLTLAGELRIRQPAYEFGFFTGLGLYRLEGETALGASSRDEALGVALGLTGDFDLTPRLSVVGEIDFHYAFLDDVKLYGAAMAGIAVHF